MSIDAPDAPDLLGDDPRTVSVLLAGGQVRLRRVLSIDSARFVAAGDGTAERFDAGEVSDRIVEWLAAEALPDLANLDASLSAAELAAVAAVVDAYREERLRALIERRPASPDRWSIDELLFELHAAHLSRSTRWLAGILAVHAPADAVPQPEALEAGVPELAARGWIVDRQGAYEPCGTLVELCERFGNVNPFAVVTTGAGPVVAIRIEGGVGIVRFVGPQAEQGPRILLDLVGAPGARRLLKAHLDAAIEAAAGDARSAGRPVDLPEPAAPLETPAAAPPARPLDLPD